MGIGKKYRIPYVQVSIEELQKKNQARRLPEPAIRKTRFPKRLIAAMLFKIPGQSYPECRARPTA